MDVLSHRQMDPQASDVHVGIDGGQKMLKLGVTITDKLDVGEAGRSHYVHVSNLLNLKLPQLVCARAHKGYTRVTLGLPELMTP